MPRAARAFVWQLVSRLAEDSFAQGLCPTPSEKDRRSEGRLGAMLVVGVLVRHLTLFEASAAMLVWVVTGRGPGRHFLLGAGGPLFGPVLTARLREHHRAILAEQAGR